MVVISMLLFYVFRGRRDFVTFVAWATGFISLVIITVSLIIGPVNLILKKKNPVSTYFRRDIGITGGVLALIHSVTGLFVHLRGKMWLYFLNEKMQVRFDNFGLANHTGVISALIILLLLITSNDYFLRKTLPRRWKNIQRLSYLMFILLAAHCYYYTIGRKDHDILFWFYIPLFLLVVISQLTGFWITIFNRSKPTESQN
jgi:sulfoxide reductase heme-binding subunit YedZ